jgi:hypothetical protein
MVLMKKGGEVKKGRNIIHIRIETNMLDDL